MTTGQAERASRHASSAPTPKTRTTFLREFIRNPRATASVAPSSRVLAERMIAGLDLANVTSIVEYGPGSGPFTRVLLERLPKNWHRSQGGKGVFIAIEFNPALAQVIREKFPSVLVAADSAANVESICQQHGVAPGKLDVIISGLGYVSFPKELTTQILEASHRALRPGGEFRTFGYHMGLMLPGAWHLRAELDRVFSSSKMQRGAWRNLPPAFMYRCVK
jgi:phosphatidylethanolamine/phosphatidyl-N-methylethanolamine N-methyltransferase